MNFYYIHIKFNYVNLFVFPFSMKFHTIELYKNIYFYTIINKNIFLKLNEKNTSIVP